jgi:hypothetical protein
MPTPRLQRVPRRLRRHPRYSSFLVTGALVGLVATLVIVLGPAADASRRAQLFFYLGLVLVGTGALLGGLLAVLIEGPVRGTRGEDAGKDATDP